MEKQMANVTTKFMLILLHLATILKESKVLKPLKRSNMCQNRKLMLIGDYEMIFENMHSLKFFYQDWTAAV